MNSYGKRLRAAREAAGQGLRSVARAVGCSAAHLSDIELDRRFPSDRLERLLCAKVGISAESLGGRPVDILKVVRGRLTDPRFAHRLVEFLEETAA